MIHLMQCSIGAGEVAFPAKHFHVSKQLQRIFGTSQNEYIMFLFVTCNWYMIPFAHKACPSAGLAIGKSFSCQNAKLNAMRRLLQQRPT